MARPTSSPDPRVAALADATAAGLAQAAQALAERGDPETAETLRAMARHNRVAALKLRTMRGVAQDWMGLARTA
ncbi:MULTISPECIES: hypothetical protein [unclassified Methylobacterium]|uniref:hypothetical protein n=1 Tax=unclassified Methylobacterium TaxID=2615210 RepID=UPI0011C1FD4F|nr:MULTISPECIES: hypothetical protein [unclassified Methylobacterium]QEE41092.1 hypothetical protein FVA80_21080 [Methylobacterium sp. WL1]TXN58946.1 hypothetical protein FV241_05075 [Methylobacterium sp. WL2]